MDLAGKLQLKPGQTVALVGAPDAVTGTLAAAAAGAADADAVIAFVRSRDDLDSLAAPALEAARADRLAWLAYPKAGKLGTDLNRDILRDALTGRGLQPVRQIAVDDTWSALRVRPI